MAGQHPSKKPLAKQPIFLHHLGLFHAAFATTDLTVDWAICKFLKITPQEAHIITGGMMFGPKARLLADLVGRSDHPKKAEILGPLNRVRGDTKRNEIAHGYLWSDDNRVRFIQRITSGEFQCRVLEFNYEQFKDHVLKLINDSTALYTALEIDYADINAFADAALSLNRKSKTSPVSPASKAE